MTATITGRPSLTGLLLTVQIGSTEEAIARLERDLAEDEAVLALIHRGTPPAGAGWDDEDECAAFVASSQRKLTALHAELDGLREKLAGLEAQVPA